MSQIDKMLALIALCVVGALIIEAHYFLRVLIHRRASARPALAHDRENNQSNRANNKSGNECKF